MDDGSVLDATALISSLTVNGSSVSIGGSVTTAKWGTARTITVADNSNTNKQTNADIDGSANFTLKLPATIKASLTGNADTATTASKLSTVSKTAWGQTYWTSDGVPTNISGYLSNVSGISINKTGSRHGWIDFHYGSAQNSTSNIYEREPGQLVINDLLFVTSGGNVGIGTVSPSYKLDVNGTVHASSFIKLNGTSSQFLKADGSVDSNTYALTSQVPTNVSQLTNDSGYITSSPLGNYLLKNTAGGIASVEG
jgi:hypothetical protein